MKSSTITAVLAPAAAAAQWWAGAPSCAQSCLSSAFGDRATSTSSVDWPSQTDYCDSSRASVIGSCLSASCSATPSAWSSYSSLSTSLCSQWSSCSSAGSTGVRTITCPGGSVSWGAPGGWSTGSAGSWGPRGGAGGGPGGWGWSGDNDGDNSLWSQWASAYSGSQTWTGGVITVTGCAGDGSPWYAGPGGGWNNHGGFNGWVGWGAGWSRGPSSTATVTYTTTASSSGGTAHTAVVTGQAVIVAAVSGDVTTTQTLGAVTGVGTASATATPNTAPRPAGSSGNDGGVITGMMGLGLGAVVGIALML
ncbi:hypothetical protein TruAng_011980 [Truncatella angustata]|nr:hypothetical protein TruAng_011980 [Truncatella angustata]